MAAADRPSPAIPCSDGPGIPEPVNEADVRTTSFADAAALLEGANPVNRCRSGPRPPASLAKAIRDACPHRHATVSRADAAEWLAAYLLAVILDEDHESMRHVRSAMHRVPLAAREVDA